MRIGPTHLVLVVAAITLCRAGQFRGASVREPGGLSLSLHHSRYYEEPGPAGAFTRQYGSRIEYGLWQDLAFTLGQEYVRPVGVGVGDAYHFLAFGPHYALWPEHLSLSLPVGRRFTIHGAGHHLWQFSPALTVSWAWPPWAELNVGIVYVFYDDWQLPARAGLNLGLALPTRRSLRLRPEIAYFVDHTGGEPLYSLGVAIEMLLLPERGR